MSKFIKLTSEFMDECRRDFEKALQMTKLSDGKFTFTKTFTRPGCEKANVYFTPVAWVKMLTLLGGFDKEVAWHGVATRYGDEEKNEYMISDILVYPQEVTGATVDTDRSKYQTWLYSHPDDVFNNIRMQGHSHVNMGVSPSTTDIRDQEGILHDLEDDMFYIFMIYNKRLEFWVRVFDMKKNTVFETADITVSIRDEGNDFASFLKTAKEMVKTKTYAAPASTGVNYGVNWKGSGGYQTPVDSSWYKDQKPAAQTQPQAQPQAQTQQNKQETPVKTEKEKTKQIVPIGAGYNYRGCGSGFYDYDSYFGGFYD